ncbi:MAG TPA: NAD(P)H-hydrate dehydratase, partial [Candidatus Cloacimonadota bacterium]|nr:NAD(P)H-hydrate dehydratase [Candidatus Cloacimonadota bacterium]
SDLTLVIGAYKYGNLLGSGNTGTLGHQLIDIGIPNSFLNDLKSARLIDADSVVYPPRFANAHKGTYGEVMVLAGSPGMAGAAILASKAALKAGAGYVRLYAHPQLASPCIGSNPELLIETVPLDADGKVDAKALSSQIHNPSVILIGPGIGTGDYGSSLLDFALSTKGIPLVLDADALKLIARKPELMFLLKNKEVLLTPHPGEFSELASVSMDEMRQNSLKHLQDYIKKFKLPVLLKSHTSVYADQYQTIFNISGNDGLATGGSGDLLAGIIASFLAQGSTIPDAASAASYLMGKTAERLSEKWETAAITPLMIVEHLFELEIED